jgi:hypothetical protein
MKTPEPTLAEVAERLALAFEYADEPAATRGLYREIARRILRESLEHESAPETLADLDALLAETLADVGEARQLVRAAVERAARRRPDLRIRAFARAFRATG